MLMPMAGLLIPPLAVIDVLMVFAISDARFSSILQALVSVLVALITTFGVLIVTRSTGSKTAVKSKKPAKSKKSKKENDDE